MTDMTTENKKIYEAPSVEIVTVDSDDIILLSLEDSGEIPKVNW
jgi:hypothetical protein